MASTNGIIFPESMVDILANPIDIFFGSMPAKSTVPAACLVIEGNAVPSDQQIGTERLYLMMVGTRGFGLKNRGLFTTGIFACVAATARCASKP
jgi:hypothetical protein